jgi:septal ring factor EnvC (AmiA/AmiB activator)
MHFAGFGDFAIGANGVGAHVRGALNRRSTQAKGKNMPAAIEDMRDELESMLRENKSEVGEFAAIIDRVTRTIKECEAIISGANKSINLLNNMEKRIKSLLLETQH